MVRELEKTSYAMFLRPRRFGKPLLCSILQAYYDVNYAARFEALFGGLDIGRNPTAEHGKYLFLNFNFTGVEKQFVRVQSSFNDYCCLRLNKFARDHAARLPSGVSDELLAAPSCHAKMNVLSTLLAGSGLKLYVVIDEYDNFTNTILAESRDNYEALCHGDGFFK